MGRRDKKKEKIGEPFVAIPWRMLNSDAYKKLRPNSKGTLPYFLGKGREASVKGEPAFEFTYREASRYGFASKTFERVITDLVAKGFIDIRKHGGYLENGVRSHSEYKCSTRWELFGKKGFVEKKRNPSELPLDQVEKALG